MPQINNAVERRGNALVEGQNSKVSRENVEKMRFQSTSNQKANEKNCSTPFCQNSNDEKVYSNKGKCVESGNFPTLTTSVNLRSFDFAIERAASIFRAAMSDSLRSNPASVCATGTLSNSEIELLTNIVGKYLEQGNAFSIGKLLHCGEKELSRALENVIIDRQMILSLKNLAEKCNSLGVAEELEECMALLSYLVNSPSDKIAIRSPDRTDKQAEMKLLVEGFLRSNKSVSFKRTITEIFREFKKKNRRTNYEELRNIRMKIEHGLVCRFARMYLETQTHFRGVKESTLHFGLTGNCLELRWRKSGR